LKKGDTLEVATPNGRFVFVPNDKKTKNIALFAAGSGITPILRLELRHQYKDRFTIKFVFSQAQEENAIFGRIEKSTVNFVVKNEHKDITIDAFYLCGPEAMIYTVKDVLTEHDIDESTIHFELFKAAKPSDIKEAIVSNGKTSITVMVDDEEHSFEMSQKQSILEAALDQDIDAPYSCQGGICSSCLAKITEGSATMRQNNILTEKEVEEGLILTCQAHPTSTSIRVDYDDV